MTRDTWVSSTCLESVSPSHKWDTLFNIAQLLTCLPKLRLLEFEIRKVILSTNDKNKILSVVTGLQNLGSVPSQRPTCQALSTTLLSFGHQLGSYSLHKRETVTTEFLLLNGRFWVNFPVFCTEMFSSTNDSAIAIAPRSVESWWSLRNEVHKQFIYTEDLTRGIQVVACFLLYMCLLHIIVKKNHCK